MHPGGIQTELGRHMSAEQMQALMNRMKAAEEAGAPRFEYKTVPQGAATSVWAGVVAPADAVGGRYCHDCHVAEVVDGQDISVISGGVRSYALNPENARALWAKSEEMVGERFEDA